MKPCLRSASMLALLAAFYAPVVAWAQQAPFTLEQVMSAPFPSALVAAPTGTRSPGYSMHPANGISGSRAPRISKGEP